MTNERSTRTDRRRARTHGRLVDATRHLIVEKGVDNVTIADITEEADIGFGGPGAAGADDGPVAGGLVRKLDPHVFDGADVRRFPRSQLAFLPLLIAGGLETVCSARLTNQLRAEDDAGVATAILTLLGVPETEANDVATRPLADLDVGVTAD
jgi:hypothetical protein